MFLRIIVGLVAVLVLMGVVAYFSGQAAIEAERKKPWPYALGTLKEFETRPNCYDTSPEANDLSTASYAVEAKREEADAYVVAQLAKPDDAIDPLPNDAGLAGHEKELAEFVQIILDSGEKLRWGQEVFGASGNAAALAAAVALDRARAGDRETAWRYTRALWILAQSLKGGCYWDARWIGLEMERRANAIARKLPPPVPPWFAELAAIDVRRDAANVLHDKAYWEGVHVHDPINHLFEPFADIGRAAEMKNLRMAAEAMAASPRCRVDATSGVPEVATAGRMDAELEATAKVLALKAERAHLGRWPSAIDSASRCAGNRWIYAVKPDGSSMTLRLSSPFAAETGAPALRFAY